MMVKDFTLGDLLGGPKVNTLNFHCDGASLDPLRLGTKMPQAAWCSQKKKDLKLEEIREQATGTSGSEK